MVSNSGQKTRNIKLGKAGSSCSACITLEQNVSDADEESVYNEIYIYDHTSGRWSLQATGGDIQSIATDRSIETNNINYYALTIDGEIMIMEKNTVSRDIIPPSLLKKNDIFFDPRAYALCVIDGCIFLCGAQGLFVSRDRSGHWSLPDANLTKTGDALAVESIKLLRKKDASPLSRRNVEEKYDRHQFYDIAGLDINDIYICGKAGAILHWNGEASIFSSTLDSIALTRIFIENSSTIWIKGLKGILLRGNSFDGFVRAATASPGDDFVSVAKFGENILTGIRSGPRAGLFHVINNTLSRINNYPAIQDLHTLNVSGNVIWLFGSRNIMRFDGANWEQISLPI